MFCKKLALLALFSSVVFLVGCKSGGTQPSNPFAQNLQTIPPPATFSSQDSYLGQTPGSFVPQVPASTFSPSGTAAPTSPVSETNANAGEGATLFASAGKGDSGDTAWVPIDVASTSNTAFQAMDAKVNSTQSAGGTQTDAPTSLVVGTSHVVTTIVDEAQPATTLSEPQTLLYSGGYEK
jgi:hypothetical protein